MGVSRTPHRPQGRTKRLAEKLILSLKRTWGVSVEGYEDDLVLFASLADLHPDPERAVRAIEILLQTHVGFRREDGRKRDRSRAAGWRNVVADVPATRAGVEALVESVLVYEDMAASGHFESLHRAKSVKLDVVVPVMIEVGRDARGYLEAASDLWGEHPNFVWSQRTLGRLRHRLRGTLGDLGRADAGRKDDELEEGVRVVE